jgi:hypothetical protein
MDSNLLIELVVQVVTGIIGGLGVGAAVKQAAMATLPKILSGGIGGIAGGQILDRLVSSGAVDAAAGAASSGVGWQDAVGGVGGGAILTAIVGAVMGAMKK